MAHLGRLLIIFGAVVIVLGVVLIFAGRIPYVGRLPGDIVWKKGNFTVYFPLTTSILLSVILTIILYAIMRLSGR